MKKLFLLTFILFGLSFGDEVNVYDVKDWHNAGQYTRICSDKVRDLFIKEQNDSVANMYAFSCLKLDKINELVIPIVMLYKDRASRENASIYSTILFQKKMLYYALVDGADISYIRTPKVEYILSYIFDKFVTKDYDKKDDKYLFDLGENNRCEVYVKDDNSTKQMVFDIYNANKLMATKIFW
ncbi:MAG: hypothetical protein MR902_03625 [Campylobacter sp.]|nr:hypothetical protein [Campylobacter sp.]